MWCPPVYVGGCSQALMGGDAPVLIRNYDYSPMLVEGTWLASRFNGKRVLAMIDCLWGVLDGVNEDGLAVSLSFGGRTVSGQGFGIPIVLRYVLEFAANVMEALALLGRIPVHMAYSVALMDRHGKTAMVFVAPDRKMEIVDRKVTTNHQHKVEWPRHAKVTKTVERELILDTAILSSSQHDVLQAFLRPPVFQTDYGRGHGTLYTALYDSRAASAELIWPGKRWRQSCTVFVEGSHAVHYESAQPVDIAPPLKSVHIPKGAL